MSDDAQNLSRRDMMRLGATGVVAAGVASLPAMADDKAAPDKLPKRRYGRTGLEIGWLVGASDWSKELIAQGCRRRSQLLAQGPGVERPNSLPPSIKSQPRESYYLECVVDRVGGRPFEGPESTRSSTTSSSRNA